MINQKAQIGETITWLVATIVIIIILSFSVFVAIPVGKSMKFESKRKSDLLATKSLTSYLLTKEGTDIIYNNLKKGKELNKQSSERIEEIYNKEYKRALLRVVSEDDYPVSASLPVVEEVECAVDVFIELNEEKDVGLCLLWEEKNE